MDGGDVMFPGVGASFDLISRGNSCNDDFRVGLGGLDDCCGPGDDGV